MKQLILNAMVLTTVATAAHSHDYKTEPKPDDHAPIGVMRDHVHKQGEVMLSYRYSFMDMIENRDGSDGVSDAQVLQDFAVAPTDMSMRMHMVGGMYGITDQLTLGVMGGFATKSMDHVRRNGTTFETEGIGFADTRVNGMYEFYNHHGHRIQANMGISIPTGTFDERAPNGARLPYPMQIGSGTYDLLPGVSYSGHKGQWSWGSQVNATIRTGKNSNGYRLGDAYNLTGWGAYRINEMFSVSGRLDGNRWGDLSGIDRLIPNFMAPTMNPTLQAGRRVDALLGVNFIMPDGPLEGHRLAFEAGAPVYEYLDQNRLGTDYRFTLGWQKAF